MSKKAIATVWSLWAVCCLGVPGLWAQQVVVSPTASPETLVACGLPGQFRVVMTNTGNNGFGNSVLTVQLPPGMYYVAGSVTGPVQEMDLTDPERPVFLMPGFPALSFREVGFEALIDCSFANDAPVRYTLLAGGQTYMAEEQPLANYFYPEVVITEAENDVLTLPVNTTGQRTYTIIQSTPGARLDTLFLVNHYEAGLAPLGLSVGTLLASGATSDTFAISGADLPGGDGFFDFGDTLIVTELVRLLECAQKNSVIELFWRCGTVVCQTFTLNTLVSPSAGVPNLQITNVTGFTSQAQANDPQLVGGGFCQEVVLQYEIANNGSETDPGAGTLFGLVVGLGLNNNLYANTQPTNLNAFPNWRLTASVNGIPVALGTYHFPDASPLAGYNLRFDDPANPIPGLVDADGDGLFNDLPVGASLQLEVRIEYDADATPDCTFLSSFPNAGGGETVLRMGYHYRNQCGVPSQNWYAVTDPGINVVSLFTHRTGTPAAQLQTSNLGPGQTTWLLIRPDGAWRSPCGATDSIVLEFVLPAGLVATGLTNGPGTHYGIVYQNGDTLRIAGTERGSLTQPWRIQVQADCGVAVLGNSIGMSFLYFCDPTCPVFKRIDCQTLPLNFLTQCESVIQGIGTRGFSVERRTLGWTNVYHTAKVDPDANPAINLKAAITYDSVEMRMAGVYEGDGPFGSLFARVDYRPVDLVLTDPTLPHFLPLGGTLHYYPAGGGELACPLPTEVDMAFDPNTNTHSLIMALEALFQPGGCLAGQMRTEGDSLLLSLHTLVTLNTPRRALPVPNLTAQYFSVLNGQAIGYNRFIDNFVLERVVPNANVQYLPQVHYGCEAIRFNSAAVTNKGHLYDGDQFPDEVRSGADVSAMRVRLEGAWGLVPGSSQLVANGSFDANDNISLVAPGVTIALPDPDIAFDGTYTTFTYTNPGTWPRGDMVIGGSNAVHDIHFSAIPGCGIPQQGSFSVRVEADMIRWPHAPLAWRDTLTGTDESSSKGHRQQQAELLLASVQEFIPVSDSIFWDFRISNTTSYAGLDKTIRFGWVAVEGGQGLDNLLLTELTDPDNPVVYTAEAYDGTNFWFQLGEWPAFASRLFRLSGTFSTCGQQTLTLRHGFSCLGYPVNPTVGYPLGNTHYTCPTVGRTLLLNPTDVSLALGVSSPPSPSPLCEPLAYELRVTNLQLPNAYGSLVTVTIPPGSFIVPGTVRLEYPAGSGQWLDMPLPTPLGGQALQWDLAQVPGAPAFIRGVNRAPANQYRIQFQLDTECSLTSGLRLGFRVRSANSCGNAVERTVFSERLQIDGVPATTNSYGLALQLPDGGLRACDTSRLSAAVFNLGPFPTSDIEFVTVVLPHSFEPVEASLTGNTTLLANDTDGVARRLRFQLPQGMPPGDTLFFSLAVRDNQTVSLDCDTLPISIGTLLETQVGCGSVVGDTCDVLVSLSNDTLQAPILKKQWAASVLHWTSVPSAPDAEWITGVVTLQNLDNLPARGDSLQWTVWWDADGDGLINVATDVLVATVVRPLPPLPPLGTLTDTLWIEVPTSQVCGLLVGVSNTGLSCLCAPFALAVPPVPALRNAGLPSTVCSGDTTVLGADVRTEGGGLAFLWENIGPVGGGQLSDASVAQPTFTAVNATEGTQTFIWQLTTTRPGGCFSRDTVAAQVRAQRRLEAWPTQDFNGYGVSCHSAADGGLLAQMTLGQPPATYRLDGGPGQVSPLFEGLPAGPYTLHLTDADGCTASATATLVEPPALGLAVSATAATCHSHADGTALAQATGGVPAYTFTWSAGAEAGEGAVSGLAAGMVSVTVVDANGCTLADTVEVTAPAPLSFGMASQAPLCHYSTDGAAWVEAVQGGTPPYTVVWDGQWVADTLPQLGAGTYAVVVEDAQGCLLADTLALLAPNPVSLVLLSSQPTSCAHTADGSLGVAVSGGTGAHQLLWSNGGNGQQVEGLAAGIYTLTVTDGQGCTYAFGGFEVGSPPPLALALVEVQGVSCHGLADGAAQVQATGGTGPYGYAWSHGASDAGASDLAAGPYTVTAVDAQGCRDSLAVAVPSPTPLVLDYEAGAPGCAGQPGFLWLRASGGTPAYLYGVEGLGWQSERLFRVQDGSYTLWVEDANGCRAQAEAAIVPPPIPLVVLLPEVLRMDYGSWVRPEAEVLHATGWLTVRWWPALEEGMSCVDCLSPVLELTETTAFRLHVVDENGCEGEANLLVIVDRPRRVYIPNVFSPNGDGVNDWFFLNGGPEVVEVVQMQIFDRWGNQVFKNEGFPPNVAAEGWDGRFRQQDAQSGVYVYFVEVQFSDGLRELYKGEVNLVR